MGEIDKRDKLKEEPFDFRLTKSGKAMIYYEGRQIMILNEKDTKRMENKIKGLDNFGIQLVLAKLTGNFKRGNERTINKKK